MVDQMMERKGVSAGNVTHEFLERKLEEAFTKAFNLHQQQRAPPAPAPAPAAIDVEAIHERELRRYKFQAILWGDGKYHRLPEGYILTCLANRDSATVARTPLQAYTRWHSSDGVQELPPLKVCDATDFSIKNQKRRFHEWSTVCRHIDRIYLRKFIFPPLRVPAKPSGEQIIAQFEKAMEIHYHIVAVFHPSANIRRKRRNGDVSKKLSTIYTEIRLTNKKIAHAKTIFRRTRGIMRLQKSVRAKLQNHV